MIRRLPWIVTIRLTAWIRFRRTSRSGGNSSLLQAERHYIRHRARSSRSECLCAAPVACKKCSPKSEILPRQALFLNRRGLLQFGVFKKLPVRFRWPALLGEWHYECRTLVCACVRRVRAGLRRLVHPVDFGAADRQRPHARNRRGHPGRRSRLPEPPVHHHRHGRRDPGRAHRRVSWRRRPRPASSSARCSRARPASSA